MASDIRTGITVIPRYKIPLAGSNHWTCVRNRCRFRFDTSFAQLPTVIQTSTETSEKKIVEVLYNWLNTEYSTRLALPNLGRLGGVLRPTARKGTVIFIGASHTANIVAKADNRGTHLLPRWTPTADVVVLLATRLKAQGVLARRTQWCWTYSATPC